MKNNPFLDTSFLFLTKNPNDPDFSKETHPKSQLKQGFTEMVITRAGHLLLVIRRASTVLCNFDLYTQYQNTSYSL